MLHSLTPEIPKSTNGSEIMSTRPREKKTRPAMSRTSAPGSFRSAVAHARSAYGNQAVLRMLNHATTGARPENGGRETAVPSAPSSAGGGVLAFDRGLRAQTGGSPGSPGTGVGSTPTYGVTPGGPAAAPAPTLSSCNATQTTELNARVADARTWIDDVEPKIAAFNSGTATPAVATVVTGALTDNFHTTAAADVSTIAANFSDLRTALNSALDLECVSSFWCGQTELAYVRGAFAWVRRLGDVNVCPAFFSCGNVLKRTETVVHEVAHQHPGATDNAYEWQSTYATLSAADAIDNAESYGVATRQIFHGGSHGPGETC